MEPSLRLLLVSFVANTHWTGMGRWTAEMKTALQERGHTVETWFREDFPRIAALGRLALLAFPIALAQRLLLHRRDFDAVIVHEPSGFWYGLLRKVDPSLPPQIVMCHNVESHHFETMVHYAKCGLSTISVLKQVRARLFRHWQSDGAIRLADHVLCLSTADAAYITTRLGVPQRRVTRLCNGTAPGDFAPQPANAGRGGVLWVGAWLDVKGRRVLPQLWRQVRQDVPGARLTLAGTGVPPNTVLSDFDARDRQTITVLPRVERRDTMRALYACAGVYLLCSLSEGSPLSLLEAMAAGTAVVATAVGGVTDIIADGTQGLLFDPRDVARGAALVSQLLGDRSEARRLSDAAFERARTLTWSDAAGALARVAHDAAATYHVR